MVNLVQNAWQMELGGARGRPREAPGGVWGRSRRRSEKWRGGPLRKLCQKASTWEILGAIWGPAGSQGAPKIDLSGTIYIEKMKKTVRKRMHDKSWKILQFDPKTKRQVDIFRKVCSLKNVFFEKGVIVYTLAGCSRMRVGEGSHTKIIAEKWEKLNKSTLKK